MVTCTWQPLHMKTQSVTLVTLVAVVLAAACTKGGDRSAAAGEVPRNGAVAPSRLPGDDGSALDHLTSRVTVGAVLDCKAPRGRIKGANELARRAAFHCTTAEDTEAVPSDTLVLISKDSLGHALTVVRVWLPNATARDEYEGLARELTSSFGSPVNCANPNRGTYWRSNGLDVSIDTMFAGGAMRWRVSLAVGASPCPSRK